VPLLVNDAFRTNQRLRRYPSNAEQWSDWVRELNRQSVNSSATTAGWVTTTTFSSTDADTVAWASGTLTQADGTSRSITGSNTGDMAALTYIYFDENTSLTTFQASTTATDATGVGKILIAVAQNTSTEAFFNVYSGSGGLNITADNIAANSITATEIAAATITATQIAADTITANEIAATTITGTEISSLSISSKTITADTGTIGGWTLSANDLSSGSFAINATNEEMEVGAATAPLTGIGIWLGLDGSDYEFRIGDPGGAYLHWNGSTLVITGADGADKTIDNLVFIGSTNSDPVLGELTGSTATTVNASTGSEEWTSLRTFTVDFSGSFILEVEASRIETSGTPSTLAKWRLKNASSTVVHTETGIPTAFTDTWSGTETVATAGETWTIEGMSLTDLSTFVQDTAIRDIFVRGRQNHATIT